MVVKLTKKGYVRINKDEAGRLRMEHNLVWESYNGPIPKGMQIHHIDEDKTNNSIENLQLVTPLEHRRIHQGCILEGDIWFKPCKVCGEYKEINEENWYFKSGGPTGRICKKCYIQKSLRVRKELISRGWKRKNYPRKK